MSYSYLNDTDYSAREEMREAKEQASIERAEAQREDKFYCMKSDSGFVGCKNQCSECKNIQTHLCN